jgi:hypothetical protein
MAADLHPAANECATISPRSFLIALRSAHCRSSGPEHFW